MQTTDKNTRTIQPSPSDMVIVIGRQFGSGGRRIGKIVADRLQCPYYDKELLAKTAERLGYAREVFDVHDERKPSPFRALLQGVYGIADNFHDTSMSAERLYKEQSEIIRQLCNQGSCVIVGRTADYVMRHHPGLVSVFLHAPVEIRAKNIVSRGESISEAQAIEKANRHDHNRERYYNYYTGKQNWGKASNYHLSLNSSALPDSELADIIINFAKKKVK
ncbi:MAG: cytidylate kinase-like family protein [Bacteroides sp.]|nr:cytidylate kinase-like family protein [Bacteroides sp.]